MKTMKFLAVVPFLCAAPLAQAASYSQSGEVTSRLTDFTSVLTVPDLAKFDGSLGNLTKVTITYEGEGTSSIGATNNSNDSAIFKASTEIDFSLVSGDAGVAALVGSQLDFAANTASTGWQTLAAGTSLSYGPFAYNTGASKDFTSGLSAFVGPGTLEFQASTLTFVNSSFTGGNASLSQETYAKATVTVTYEYTPAAVPEPSSVLMLGLAAGVVGLGARFRKRSV